MTSRAELKNALALAEKKRMDVTNKNLSLGRELGRAQEEAKAREVTITTLREELDKAKAKLTDSIREKALAFAIGGQGSRMDATVLQRAANYEMYLRKGVSVPVYTNDQSDIRSTLAWLFESATEEQADLLSTLSGQVDSLQAAYKEALRVNAERQETTEADVTVTGEAEGPSNETLRRWVIDLMAARTSSLYLRSRVEEALEWVLEDDSQSRFDALALTKGNLQRAKIVHSLRRGEV